MLMFITRIHILRYDAHMCPNARTTRSLQAEAARKAYLQRRHELEVQALLREQAHLSEASNREERYEAALAQHKLAEMKTLQERVSALCVFRLLLFA